MKKKLKIIIAIFFIIFSYNTISLSWDTNSTDADLANSAMSFNRRQEWPINSNDVGNWVSLYYSGSDHGTPTIYRRTAFCVGETYGASGSGANYQYYKITAVVKMRGKNMTWWSEKYRNGNNQQVKTGNMAYQMAQIGYCAYKAEGANEGRVSPDDKTNTWKSALKYTFKWTIENGKFNDMRMGYFKNKK